eukprot:751944-Hanusia_phi.AAC.3
MFYSSSPKSQHTPTSLLHMLQQVRARTERSHKEQEEQVKSLPPLRFLTSSQLRHLQQQLSHLELENDRLLSASRTAQNDTREDLRASLQELTRARGELEKVKRGRKMEEEKEEEERSGVENPQMRRGEAALKQLVEETVKFIEEGRMRKRRMKMRKRRRRRRRRRSGCERRFR